MAFVGTVVYNIMHNRPWNDNLWHNMLVGGITTSIGALATLALAEVMPVVVAVVIVAVAGTIILNLINGQRWDKGILVNAIIAILLALAGEAAMPKPSEPPIVGRPPITEPQPGRPGRPGMPEEPVPCA